MMMKNVFRKQLCMAIFLSSIIFAIQPGFAFGDSESTFTEPLISNYEHSPIFVDESVKPNVMIILDNSGSMQQHAYPENSYELDSGDGIIGSASVEVAASDDDVEEDDSGDMLWAAKRLRLGKNIVGIRFQDVDVPKGVYIKSAYIQFTSRNSQNGDISLTIEGEASGDADPFVRDKDDDDEEDTHVISTRNATWTSSTVSWSPEAWSSDQVYQTADISTIIQEMVDHSDWSETNNSLVFRITKSGSGTGKRVAYSRNFQEDDDDTAYPPVLSIFYTDSEEVPQYYGYFNPDFFYKYQNARFEPEYKKITYDATGNHWNVYSFDAKTNTTLNSTSIVNERLWDGNWMNWMSMMRIDVVRKVLIGGDTKSTSATSDGNNRDGSGEQVIYGYDSNYEVKQKEFDSSDGIAVSPYDGVYKYKLNLGNLTVYDEEMTYNMAILKNAELEPESFHKYNDGINVAGVLQRLGENANWGNIWFLKSAGGMVENAIGADMAELVYDLESKNPSIFTWTPLAETLYVTMQYFKQESPQGYSAKAIASDGNENKADDDDPFYRDGEEVPCAKSFVILLSDGEPTQDRNIPNQYKDTDDDGDEEKNENFNNGCSDYLDDVALYAHINDLRDDLTGDQTLTLYTIYAFGDSETAIQLLKDAAKNGGFEDSGNSTSPKPDIDSEWDSDGDGVPDNFFNPADGFALEASLISAIASIGKTVASSSSASVLGASNDGEGSVVQAYYKSVIEPESSDEEEARWLGFMHSFWVDANGDLRNDNNEDGILDDGDEIVTFVTNEEGNVTVLLGDDETEYEVDDIETIKPLFEAGSMMAEEGFDPEDRKIFTFIDKNENEEIDDSGDTVFDSSGDIISFKTASVDDLLPYFGVSGDTAWGDSGADLGSTVDDRAENIISWVRGEEVTGLRNRTVDGKTYRLGDIMNSSPVTIGKAPDSYHITYSDESYLDYYNGTVERETVVYVGANDGMLHAFTHGKFLVAKDEETGELTTKYEEVDSTELGTEIWAFIPQAVLPHLKWVAQNDYSHTYLVDAKPRIFDAELDGEWGTFLVMGLNMGAKEIPVEEDFGDGEKTTRYFKPTYFCLDITEPREPKLLWEKTYDNLNMSRSRPAPVKVDDKWFAVFGSGPTDYDCTSSEQAYFYLVDLATGELEKKFGPLDDNAYFNDPISFDKDLNYNVDAIYAATSYLEDGDDSDNDDSDNDEKTWKGNLYKFAVPCNANCSWSEKETDSGVPEYDTDPDNWYKSIMFHSPDAPITAPASVSIEVYPDNDIDNVWVYFGTGRYSSEEDLFDSDQQYIYGIKDPFFNKMYKDEDSYQYNYEETKIVQRDRDCDSESDCDSNGLICGNAFKITTTGLVLNEDDTIYEDGNFLTLEEDIQDNYDGWYRELETFDDGASERVISKASLLGGALFVTSYTPDDDICDRNGDADLYGIYYATGTGYTDQIFDIKKTVSVIVNGKEEEIVEVKCPDIISGQPSPPIGMHAGGQGTVSAYMQFNKILVDLPFYTRSSIIDWWNDDQKED
ncbi:MAG: hypothetical protein GY874_18645 [Desulfobacteraceae bacterium]|nr:hypothetical protein [Desulfobacteraceae bacterium]